MDKKAISTPKNADAKDEIDLGRLYGSLLDHRWLIAGVTALFTLIGVLYAMFATPVYQATALVQVEKTQGNIVMNNLSGLLPDAKPNSNAEIELLTSRMVLGKTIEDLGLDTGVEPHYFPLIGKGWARLIGEAEPTLAVSRFRVPTPLLNQPLNLTLGADKRWTLSDDNDRTLLSGRVGQLATRGDFSLLISGSHAAAGQSFSLTKRAFLPTYNALFGNLVVEDRGKDSGVLNMTLTGTDPELTQRVLNSIADNYLLQNVARKSAEAEKSLSFVQKQLPEVRARLDEAENKLNAFRQSNDSVDLSLEAKSMLDTMVNVDNQLNELTFREAEISKLYTREHPAYRTLLEKRQTLIDEKKRLESKVGNLPRTQQEIIRLTRDVDAGQAVYMQLLNKQQELSINKASTVGNVRIIDRALVQYKPIAPRTPLIVGIALVLGLIFSTLYVLIKTIMVRGVESPEQLENNGINVYASIPLSEWQQQKDRQLYKLAKTGVSKPLRSAELLALANPADLAVEAIRSLRTTMHFAMLDAKNNVVMISGTSPGIGKTFVSSNLATVVAQSGQRVVFVDADMRKGYAHDLFHKEGKKGLSDLLSHQLTLEQAIQPTDIPNLDFVARGQMPPNPSELLMSQTFTQMLDALQKQYDIVIVDTPPILAVTDAAVIGMQAGTSLLVAGFEKTTVKEVEVSIRRFEQNGIEIKGAILNLVMKKAAGYYGYGYYHYRYESQHS
ncbi:tyrosine-protein kinase Wzc [Pantoea sp. 1.19]|uniref:tyrosine-protein kinase Wzc n=1 Tax=Pantoea sp. 1.19 TaxID=1925589 RepID=UPI000948F2F8|nr:tyrosine-protein kinase Wzc [Pantoea sp. 1.19]